jgi:hypothetical protein
VFTSGMKIAHAKPITVCLYATAESALRHLIEQAPELDLLPSISLTSLASEDIGVRWRYSDDNV